MVPHSAPHGEAWLTATSWRDYAQVRADNAELRREAERMRVELEGLHITIAALQRRQQVLARVLRALGTELEAPLPKVTVKLGVVVPFPTSRTARGEPTLPLRP